MIITPAKHGLEDIVGVSTTPRTPGLHISEIYNDLYQDMEPKRFVRGSAPDPLRLEAGLALENMVEQGLKERFVGGIERPGEFVTEEGILYTPDLIIFDSGPRCRLGEIKLTWMLSREVPRTVVHSFPPQFEKWFTQIKSYCYHLDLLEARLIAYFVNGDNRPPRPELLAWDIEFTKAELQRNWQMMMNHARSKPYLRDRLR